MSQQIQITGGAKVRNLEGVLTGTAGVVNALGINVPSGIPQLDGSGKILVSQLPNSVMEYKGTWNAATNTPTLADGTGNQGDVYLCNVAGTANFGSGPIAFAVGDQAIYSGTIWQKAGGSTGTVTSVAVTETGDALTITGSPITTSGTINIGFAGTSGQYVNGAGGLTTFPSLTGFVPYTGATANVDLGTFDLTADVITGATGSFASSGGSNTFAINHSSGSGIALNITKGGNGEGLYINKTSGSGNAATIIGTLNATTLVKSGGKSIQFLKADGSVDSNTYATTTQLGNYLPLIGGTLTGDLTISKADTLNVLTLSSTNTNVISFITSSVQKGEISVNASNFQFNSATNNGYIFKNSAANNVLTITDEGVTTLIGALTGTSATFSVNQHSTVVNSFVNTNTTSTDSRTILNVTGGNATLQIQSIHNTGIFLNPTTPIPTSVGYNNTLVLLANGNTTLSGQLGLGGALSGTSATFSSTLGVTGAANFASSVTAGDLISTSYGSARIQVTSTTNSANSAFRLGAKDSAGTAKNAGLYYVAGTTTATTFLSLVADDNNYQFNVLANGNVGIGTTSPNYPLHIYKTSNARLGIEGTTNFAATQYLNSGGSFYIGIDDSAGANFTGTAYGRFLYSSNAYPMSFFTDGTERMRITSGGDMLLGATSFPSGASGGTGAGTMFINNNLYIGNTAGTSGYAVRFDGYANNLYAIWQNASGTDQGGVYLSYGATSWTANSDLRLKDINGSIDNAIDKLNTLRAVNFSWKSDETKKEMLGLIAQDVEKVFPQVIDENKDGYMGVRYTELVPVLIAAIQELKAEIDELKQLIKNK
jgi:hypothetical protein